MASRNALATAAWVGGLPTLLFALIEQRRFGPAEARDCTLDVCSRFSSMAMIAVTLVVASGIANAGFRVSGSFGKLFGSAYGKRHPPFGAPEPKANTRASGPARRKAGFRFDFRSDGRRSGGDEFSV